MSSLCCISGMFPSPAFAQDQIKSQEVDIVKSYQPLLADADKIDFEAEPAPVDTTMQSLKYDVKGHLIDVPFTPAEIRAVSLPTDAPEPLQNNLLKAGFGMQLTPLLDLYLHNGRSDKFSYGLDFHHLSSNGSKIDYQDFSHTGGTVFGKAFVGSTALSGSIGYDHRKNYNYAEINSDTSDASKQSLKRRYNYLPVTLGFENTKKTKGDFNYRFNLSYHHFNAVPPDESLFEEKEDEFNFTAILQKQIRKIHSANLEFNYENLQNKGIGVFDTMQSVYSIVPYYQLRMEKLNITLGANISIFDKQVTLFPRIAGEYKLIGEYLVPYIAVEGGWKPVTMQELTTINPYLGEFTTTMSKVYDAYIGFKGSYGNNISYNVRGGYQMHNNMAFFLPDTLNPAYYDVHYYYKANILNVHAELGYRESERINLVLSGEANSYDLDFNDQPWGIPKSRLDFTFNYNLQNKIFAQIDLFANSGAYTILPGDSASTQLKGRADVNLSLTYNYKKNIAFWFALNNITASKSTAWYNYPTYGFQAMAGVKLRF